MSIPRRNQSDVRWEPPYPFMVVGYQADPPPSPTTWGVQHQGVWVTSRHLTYEQASGIARDLYAGKVAREVARPIMDYNDPADFQPWYGGRDVSDGPF